MIDLVSGSVDAGLRFHFTGMLEIAVHSAMAEGQSSPHLGTVGDLNRTWGGYNDILSDAETFLPGHQNEVCIQQCIQDIRPLQGARSSQEPTRAPGQAGSGNPRRSPGQVGSVQAGLIRAPGQAQ